jgi:predicted nucleic acid-binding protein
MRFWDASALVPLVVAEPSTAILRRLASEGDMVTWCLSAVEISSAIERRTREGALTSAQRAVALETLVELSQIWTEITAVAAVRERAMRLLAVHALRSADALQLAAALVAAGDRPAGHEFVCVDARLATAAAREGYRLLQP